MNESQMVVKRTYIELCGAHFRDIRDKFPEYTPITEDVFNCDVCVSFAKYRVEIKDIPAENIIEWFEEMKLFLEYPE